MKSFYGSSDWDKQIYFAKASMYTSGSKSKTDKQITK